MLGCDKVLGMPDLIFPAWDCETSREYIELVLSQAVLPTVPYLSGFCLAQGRGFITRNCMVVPCPFIHYLYVCHSSIKTVQLIFIVHFHPLCTANCTFVKWSHSEAGKTHVPFKYTDYCAVMLFPLMHAMSRETPWNWPATTDPLELVGQVWPW